MCVNFKDYKFFSWSKTLLNWVVAVGCNLACYGIPCFILYSELNDAFVIKI